MSWGSPRDMREAVDAVLTQIEFTSPVCIEDTVAVKEAIATNVPDKRFSVEVYHRHRDVVVLVLDRGQPVFSRIVPVTT